MIIIPPNKKVNFATAVPSSKSYTNRALILAALADGKSIIINPLVSDDTKVMTAALKELGVKIKKAIVQNNYSALEVDGCGGVFQKPIKTLFLGNAGTAVRFLTAALAAQDFESRLTGNARMKKRPIGDLIEALKGWGAKIESQSVPGCLPLKIAGPLRGGKTTVNGSISSQYLSALLIAAPYTRTKSQIKVKGTLTSLPYVDMTLDTIKKFGGKIGFPRNKDGIYNGFSCIPHRYKGAKYEVEGDASSASYPWAIAALTGGSATVTNVPAGSKQADMEFLKVLKKMGCKVETVKSKTGGRGTEKNFASGITVRGPSTLKALGTINLNRMPDSAMTVAVLCAFADGKSRLTGLGNLRVKETDRLSALETELKKTGVKVRTGKDWIEIEGGTPPHGAEIDTYDDHRMAMCFAVMGAKISGITIKNPKCVSKTYPDFFKDYQKWTNTTL